MAIKRDQVEYWELSEAEAWLMLLAPFPLKPVLGPEDLTRVSGFEVWKDEDDVWVLRLNKDPA